jgi:hypothetical protein
MVYAPADSTVQTRRTLLKSGPQAVWGRAKMQINDSSPTKCTHATRCSQVSPCLRRLARASSWVAKRCAGHQSSRSDGGRGIVQPSTGRWQRDPAPHIPVRGVASVWTLRTIDVRRTPPPASSPHQPRRGTGHDGRTALIWSSTSSNSGQFSAGGVLVRSDGCLRHRSFRQSAATSGSIRQAGLNSE